MKHVLLEHSTCAHASENTRTAKQLRFLGILFALVLLSANGAFAAVAGSLLSGSTGTVTVSLSSVIFNNDPAALGGGNSDVATGTVLSFSGCPSGTLNAAGCLQTAEGITVLSPFTQASIPSNNFMTFAFHPNLVFSVLGAGPGSPNTNCASVTVIGTSCSVIAGSPILLTLQANNTTLASLAVNGKASDTGTGGLATGSPYNGSFSQTLTALLPNGATPTPANIQLYFCPSGTCTAGDLTSGRSITSSQSGSFFATAASVPEPSALGTAALGLFLIGIGTKRTTRKR